jgi:hypothetical protein
MSRRHHGRSRHARGRNDEAARTQAPTTEPRGGIVAKRPPTPPAPDPIEPAAVITASPPTNDGASTNGGASTSGIGPADVHGAVSGGPSSGGPPANGTNGSNGNGHDNGRIGCTAPQLRRFIKSRPYVPMHELRRRFGINGVEDDVTPLALSEGSIYVGLPEREGRLLGELVRGGEVGYELSLDPRTPIVVGVYPMRPVPRG